MLKKVFREGNREAERAYRQVIQLMLQGLGADLVQGEPAVYQEFRAGIDRFSAAIGSAIEPDILVSSARELMKVVEKYGRSTTEFVHNQRAELHSMVSMLIETTIKVGAHSDVSVAKLREIAQALAQAGMASDIQHLGPQLSECLTTVLEETQRRKADSEVAIAKLEQDLGASRQQKALDTVTGLPGKKEAELALRSAVSSPGGKFVLIAVVSRVNAINARFGYTAGDRILSLCAKHFRSGLASSDQLYRWQGPAFLAILSRDKRIDQVRSEIRCFADASVQETVQLGSREVSIQVSTNWSITQPSPPYEALQRKIETFTAAQVPRDYA